MPSLLGRALRLARSPAGKRLIAEAQKAARDPKNKARIEQLRSRLPNRVEPAEHPRMTPERERTNADGDEKANTEGQ
jgi:hypothetical protein